ncbi:hypothetical protein HNO92_002946 [Chromobacterium alkanivorans]|uniref:hypothetical protein n=1 Tax=Chromobacterium TaxID=535 RepID=UPI0012E1E914|nr:MULTISPECIES: hypothetical protein [Chromobacterium]MBN3003112.1 hypothetical protein [Chromobacterium alkanivorans]MCS3803710.1 hypothetical protein [Chromobacterium alkanivorans]MCS3818185.1 hypothetical protein [Chromobacterium alkanivorans]MCS3874616.1 hypothetical protein [Chromobacterium alkanivorans]
MFPRKLMLAVLGVATPFAAVAADVYIGMLSVNEGALRLTRCSLGKPIYLLLSQEGRPLTEWPGASPQALEEKARTSARILGEFEERDGKPALRVERIDAIRSGESCHLDDWLNEQDASGTEP